MPSPSSCTDGQVDHNNFEPISTDMAIVPEQDISRPLPTSSASQRRALEFSMAHNIPGCSKSRAGISNHPIYAHYSTEQMLGHWSGALLGQYSSPAYPHPHHLMSEHNLHQSGYHHGNVADWSQYSLYSYSC